MTDSWGRLFTAMTRALPDGTVDSARRCAAAMNEKLAASGGPSRRTVLVAYGGGKDSSYMVAFVRLVQLVHQQRYHDTFTVRVLTNRQPGMSGAVLGNIARVYEALEMTHDPLCELIVRDGALMRPFAADLPHNPDVLRKYRADILMAGHRTAGSGRPTFCNSCNFDMIDAFVAGAAEGDGVSLVITGDSVREQRMYQIWIHRLADRFLAGDVRGGGFRGFQRSVSGLSDLYFRDLHGGAEVPGGRGLPVVERPVEFFSIYDYTDYSSGGHWDFLTGFLGFRFDEESFHFTESDCANPLLMAHLRGLRVEHSYGRQYAEGVDQYVSFALALMAQKDIPEHLIEVMRKRYAGAGRVERMRALARRYAQETYGLTDEHLICMVMSPFVNKGEGLDRYLRQEKSALAHRAGAVHAALAGADPQSADLDLTAALESMSGLAQAQLRHLYGSSSTVDVPAPAEASRGSGLIAEILARDPHKAFVSTTSERDGIASSEVISGR